MAKTILITGASSGIGRAAAVLFLERGWNVVATMPEPASGEALAGHDNLLVAMLDVRDEASIAKALAAGRDRFGSIDAVLSNAGYGQYGVFEGISPAQVKMQFDVNVFGAMNVLRAVLPEFRSNGGGLVLVTSSSGGIYGLPTMSLYITTKFAIEGFFESVSYELASQGVAVKLIEPGGVETNFHETAAGLSTGDGGIPSYREFNARVTAVVDRIIARHELVRAEEVAEVLFEAANDGKDQLRYVVGPDAAKIIDARRTMPEIDFRRLIASEFGVTPMPGTSRP